MRLALATLLLAAAAAPLGAQEIDYQTGQYEYAQSADPAQDNDVVTETVTPPQPTASRVIMERRNGPAPVFVARPMVQPLPQEMAIRSAAPAVVAAPARPVPMAVTIAAPAPGTAPVLYAYPASTASRSVPAGAPGRDPALVAPSPYEMPQGYVMATRALPEGAQLVAFDRSAWLAACRERVATYPEDQRDAVLASLGGAAMGHVAGRDGCATYLDSYLANASAEASAGQATMATEYGQAYMLVPVTVMVAGQGEQ